MSSATVNGGQNPGSQQGGNDLLIRETGIVRNPMRNGEFANSLAFADAALTL